MSLDEYEFPFVAACQNTFLPVRARGKNPRRDARYVRLNAYKLGALIEPRIALLLTGIKDRRTLRKRFRTVRDKAGFEWVPKPELIAFFASLSHRGNLSKKPKESKENFRNKFSEEAA